MLFSGVPTCLCSGVDSVDHRVGQVYLVLKHPTSDLMGLQLKPFNLNPVHFWTIFR